MVLAAPLWSHLPSPVRRNSTPKCEVGGVASHSRRLCRRTAETNTPSSEQPRSRGATSMEQAMNVTEATVAIPGYLAGTWKADPVHSEIAFSVRHLMVGKVRGRFTGYDVTIVTSDDPLGASVAATIDLASIDTGNEPRDNHLRSADYFEVEKYPTMSYRSTGIRRVDDGWVID